MSMIFRMANRSDGTEARQGEGGVPDGIPGQDSGIALILQGRDTSGQNSGAKRVRGTGNFSCRVPRFIASRFFHDMICAQEVSSARFGTRRAYREQ